MNAEVGVYVFWRPYNSYEFKGHFTEVGESVTAYADDDRVVILIIVPTVAGGYGSASMNSTKVSFDATEYGGYDSSETSKGFIIFFGIVALIAIIAGIAVTICCRLKKGKNNEGGSKKETKMSGNQDVESGMKKPKKSREAEYRERIPDNSQSIGKIDASNNASNAVFERNGPPVPSSSTPQVKVPGTRI